MRSALRVVFKTGRGLRTLALNFFAFFGAVSAGLQFYGAVFVPDKPFANPLTVVLIIAGLGILFALWRTWPRSKISQTFNTGAHEVTVDVVVGDILDHKGQIVVGFSDTFDTDTSGDKIIKASSLQGQLLKKRFNNDSAALDQALATDLNNSEATSTEHRANKPLGKLDRYPIGTVAVIGQSVDDRVYALAYSTMGNNLLAQSSVHDVWCALGQLWTSVYEHGQQEPVALPLVGTGLARINYLDRESMLRMALLSFVARSRETFICEKLTVYIHESDRDKINMLELKAFLKTL